MFIPEYEFTETPRQRGSRFSYEESYRRVMPVIMSSPRPPWKPITSRETAKLLQVTLQTLANWRVRDDGPEYEPYRKGDGNKVYYRPDKLLTFLDVGCRGWWEWSADWLRNIGLWTVDFPTEEGVSDMIAFLDEHMIFKSQKDDKIYVWV